MARWFGQLRKRWFDGTDNSRPAPRKAPSARLGVEALERRELLSGNTLGYVLQQKE